MNYAAAALIDAMVAAHFIYADTSGRTMEKVFSGEPVTRETTGLCSFVYYYLRKSTSSEEKTAVDEIFGRVLCDMYGETDDPLSTVPGGSYYQKRLNYAVRSREALRIAKWVEEKFL